MSTQPELAIVIPAKNEADFLPRLLNSLCNQDYPRLETTKVFIADAESTDGTADLALAFRNRLNIEVIAGGMPSVGRNRGAARSNARFLLFLDADIELPDPTLIRRALDTMRRRRLHCATVDIACSGGSWLDRLMYSGNNQFQRLSAWFMPFGTGMFLLFDRSRFDALGGFNEEALFAEDYLLTKQISPLRFAVVPGEVLTSNRRFRRTGKLRMLRLFFWTVLNSFNTKHFQRDHGYWKVPEEAGIK